MRKILPFILIGILIVSCLRIDASPMKNTNKQIYLGYANIIGNGNSSILEVVAENDLIVGIENKTSNVDFYINYNMICNGVTDNGSIVLIVTINGQNITPAFVTTATSQTGILKVEDVQVSRTDSFTFVIQVIYGSLIPFYINQTQAFGTGVVAKAKGAPFDSVWFEWFFQRFPNAFPLLRQLRGY